MKNINIEEVKRYLKRSLKNKVKITTSLIVLFMMSNSIVSGHVIVVDKGKIGSGNAGAAGKKWGNIISEPPKGAIALNISATDENRVAHENVGSYSVAVGYEAKAKAENSVAIGRGSNIEDGATNSIAIGREAKIFKSDQIESNSNGDEDITERSIAIGRKAETKIYKSTAIGSEASAESALIYNPYVLEKYKAIYETFKNDITIKGEGYKFSKNDINSLKTKYLSKIEEQKREIAEIENKIKAIDNNTEKKKIFLGRQELNDQKNELIRKKHDLNINTETLKQIFEKKFAYLNDKNLEKKQVLNQFNDEKIITQGGEGVSIGSKTKAVDQATSIGNQTYAIGRSSIALGSDDNRYFTEKVTDEDKKHYFEGIYKVIDPNNTTYTPPNLRQYSPTLAAGDGGIAIGTRALSYGIGATSIGAFSYALGDYSTAMGAETRAEGYGAIAVGNKTKVFSDYAVAVGNENQVSQSGGLAYGFKAISSGRNTIAIGTDVYGNVNIDDSKGIHSKYKQINKNTSKVEDKLKNNINGRKKVHDEYDKIDETLKNLENSYTIDSSYSANDVDKKLKYNGVEEKTGKKVKEQNGNNAIVIGTNAVAKGNNSITLGHASFSMKDNSAAIGSLTYVDGKNSIGLGIGTRVFSDNSLAVGIGSVIARDSQNSLVFGNAAYVGSINSIALGNKASVTLDNSLALGNNSTTDYNPSWLNEKGYVPKGAISLPSSTNVGVISVGSIGQERRITNVAAGYRDTDAVNVSQLKSVEDKLSAVNLSGYDSSMVNFVSVNKTDGEGKKMQDLAIRMGNYKEYIQLKSKLLEMKVRKEKNHETINIEVEKEIEKLLEDEKYNDIKNKDENFKKFETQVTNKIKGNVEVKDILTEIDKKKDELIEDKNLKSILNDEEIKKFEKSNFYNKSTTGKNAIAIGVFADATKEQAVAIGKNAKGDSWSVAIGGDSESGNTAVAIGDRAKALGGRSVAIGHGAKANHNDSVAIGKDSEANSSTDKAYLTDDQNGDGRTFAVGGTVKRRITGVSDGSADSDAVTVAQLKRVGNITFTGDTGSNVKFELVKNIDIKGATAKKQNNIDIETWGQGDNKHTVENIQTHVSKNGDTQRILIGMKDVPRFTGIKLGGNSDVNLTVSNEGNLNLNNKKITGLADGDISNLSTDAVTGKQLEARTKFTIQADEYRENKTKTSDKSFELSLPQKIIFRGASKSEEIEVNGKNGKEKKSVPKTYDTTYATENVRTYIEKNGNDYEVIVAFKNKPKFDKVQIGEVGGFVISKNSEAFEFSKKKLGNVAPGRIGDKSGDVVVGDQLKDYVKKIVSSNDSDISVTSADIMESNNKVGVKYTLGLKQDLKNKINEIDTKASKSELKALEDKKITFIGDTRGANKDDIKVKLGEEIEIKAEDHWNFNKKDKKFDESQDNYETENLSTYYRIKDGKKQILIGMKDKPRFEEVTIGKSTENRISITKDGISITKKVQDKGNNNNPIDKSVKIEVDDNGSLKLDSKKLTGLAEGTDNTDAVNMQQLNELKTTVTNNTSSITDLTNKVTTNTNEIKTVKETVGKGIKFKSDFGNEIETKLDGTLEIHGGKSKNNEGKSWEYKKNQSSSDAAIQYTTENVMTKVDDGKIYIGLKKNTQFESVTFGENGPKLSKDANNNLSIDSKKITGLAAGTDSTDAVNKKQLDEKASATELNTLKRTVTTNTSSINTNKEEIAKKLNKDDLSIEGDTYISVGGTDKKYKLTFNKSELEKNIDLSKNTTIGTINENLNKKANSDATNITDTIWREKLNVYSKTETNNEIKKVKVVGTNDEIDVSPNDKTFTVSLSKTMKDKIDAKANTSDLEAYAKKDASNITESEWVTKLGDDSLESGSKLAKSSAVKEYVDKINSGLENKGLKFNADQGGEQTQKLGSSIKIASATEEISENNTNYLGKNIKTKITKDGDNSTISLAFSDSPEFSSVKIGDSEIKQTTDGNNKNITINGDTVITTKNILSQTIGYKANDETAKKVSLENGFTFKNTDNITSKANDNGEVSFELNKDLKKINSIENDGTDEAKKTKVTLTENGTEFKNGTDGVTTKIGKDGLEITKGSKTVTIKTTDKGGSITGLEDRKVSNSNYGEAGRVATEGAVKEIYDQLNSNNGVSNKLNELRRGLAGSVVYTDKEGNRVARANNGKVYSIEAVDENGELKVGHSYAKVIEPENVVLSTVNSDGKTTKPITIGNVASALGLSKDKKDNNGILDKLVNKTANPNIYTEKEFNKVVTLRDLQFLASKGITFAGSIGTATKFLGDTITINGSNTSDYKDLDKNNNFATKYETKNIAVKVDNTNGNIEVGLAKELKNINSIESNETEKAKITLSKDKGIEFTTDDKGKTVTIKTTDKGGSITGLEEKTVDTNYGTTEGEVATRKEVKSIYDKIKSTSSEVGKVTLTLTTDDNPATEKKVNLKKDKIKYANGINTKATIEQDNTKNLTTVKYDINSELKGIKNISSDSNGNSTKLTLNDNELLINNKKIKGIAKGDLSENSTDAVTGGQVYEIKNKVDKLTTNNYINFAGDNGDDIKLSLSDKLSIVGEGNTTPAKTAENNITVDSDKANKKLTVKLAKDLQNIGSVTFKQGDKTTKISIDNSTGDLNITKNGDTKTEKILTTNNIGGQKIYYTSNSDTNKKETTLTNGFDFTSTDLKITTEDNGKVTFNLTDKVKNSLNGKDNDGRDGKSGYNSAGSKGLTGKDGLNGKDLTTKVNALRNGEAGTVVYTDKDGNRLVKANNGKYYNSESVDDKGNLKVGNSYANEVKDIFATVVNSDGSTKKPTTKLRIADGSISAGSKEAVTGGQVYDKLKEYALKDASNIDVTKWVTKLGDDSLENGNNLAKSKAVKEYVDKINSGLENKGLKFNADQGGEQTQKLGSSIKIASATEEISENNTNYLGKNIKTKITKDGDNSTISLAFSDSPEFSSVKIGDNGKTVSITTTDKGGSITGLEDRKVSNSNYGEAGRVATEGAVKEIYDQLNSNNGVSNKLNELRNGLAGTVIYTDKDGNKLVKLKGKFYKQSELKNGELPVGHSYDDGLDAKDIFLSTVNPDGSTTTPTTKLRIADGSISAGSKEAVTGGQVYELKNKIEDISKKQFIKFKGDTNDEQTLNLGDTLEVVGEGDTTPAETAKNNITVQADKNKLTVKLAKNLQNMKSFETEAKNGNKTILNQDGLKIGNDTNAVTITNESITGLKDTSVDNTKYGQSGVVATQKEVKAVLNKVHSNEIEQKKIKDGLAGTVVYTDKDGNKLVKLNGKFYKQSELKNGELPVGSSYKDGIKEEDIFLSTVNPDGKTTKPITLGNVASALGLSKDSKNNSEILKKLVNKEAKDVYKDAELNKVVTLRDLQFLAKQGITFAGSTGTANKYLGDTISINSKTSDYKDLNKGGFTTNYVTKNIAVKVDNTSGDIEIGLAKELKDIKSISSENDKSKIELTDSGLKLTNDKATLSIEKDDNGFKLSGLKDSDINNSYGQSGVAATQKEVKDVLDKVNKNIKGQNDLKDGLAGTVIYTDKDGNKLVKVNGAYYKQSDVKDDGNIKDNATSISSDNIKVTLVGADGSIDKGVTLGNLKSTLGLNKANNGMTEINKKSILSKLTGNENYSEKELDNAVSLRDLQFVAKTGLVFSGNSGSVIKPIGETVRIIGGAKLSEKILEDTSSVIDPKAKYSDNGKEDFEKNFTSSSIATRVNEEGNIQIGISKDIKDIRTIEFTKGENEKAIGKIKGLANGEISSTSNDAINGAQLNDILDKVGIKVNDDKTGFNTLEISEIGGKKPSNILEGLNKTIESVNEQSVGYKANNGKVETVKLKEGFNFVNGTNITASVAKDGEIKYSLNKELKGIKGIELKNKDKKLSLAVNNKGEAVIRKEESIQSTEKVITTDDKLKLKFKSSTASDKNEKVINIAKNEALDFKAGSNLTSKVSDGSIEYGLKSDLKGITSISGGKDDKSKIELTDSGLKLTNDKATLSIEKDDNGFKLSGLKDSDINNSYGQSGVAATQKEVKDVLDKVNKNIKGQNDLKDGLAGTVIYTDKDGNKLVKVNGKFYKQSELKNGELPVGSSYKDGIKEKDIFLSTVNPDGSTTTPTTKLRIADGSISAGSKEAVTGGQVYELKNKIEDISKKQFIKFKGDTNDEQTLNLGDTLEVVGEGDITPAETAKNNITVQAEENKLTVKLAKKLQNMKSFETEAKDGNKTTLNQDGLKIGNDTKAVKITNESITGLTERKVSGSDYGEKGRAATEGAVKEVYDKLNTLNQGLTFKANKGQTKKEIGKILGVLGGATLKEKLIEDRSSIIDPKAKSSDNGKEDFDMNYNSKNVATRVSEDNNIHIGVSKELKDMRSFETEKDGEGNSSKLNQKELSIIGKDGSINISNNEIKFDKNGGTISGLKGGKIEAGSTDAVSGGQVYEKLKTIDSHLNTNYYNKSKINEMIGEVDKKSTVALEKSELALGGVANAVAMANLVQVNSYSRHRHNLSAAYGYYGGSHALAVGFSGTNEERNFVYKLSGSVNNKGNLAFGVGAGVMLGEENENNYPEKVKKVSELENKVKKQEEEINKLKKQAEKTDMLEKQVAELMKLIKKKN